MMMRSLTLTEHIFNLHCRKGILTNLRRSRTLLISMQDTTLPSFSPLTSYSTSKTADDTVEDISYNKEPEQELSNSIEQRDFYEVLNITPDATTTEIREAFFRKAKSCHPDIDASPTAREEFVKSREAYQVLSNALQRHEYDKLILVGGSGRSSTLGLNEEQEKRALEKIKEDQETFLVTKRDMRKQTEGRSIKWYDEYEWYLKLGERSGGRNLRLSKQLFRKGYLDPRNTVMFKIDSFIKRKWIYAPVEVDGSEVLRRHKLSTAIMFALFGLALALRLM